MILVGKKSEMPMSSQRGSPLKCSVYSVLILLLEFVFRFYFHSRISTQLRQYSNDYDVFSPMPHPTLNANCFFTIMCRLTSKQTEIANEAKFV